MARAYRKVVTDLQKTSVDKDFTDHHVKKYEEISGKKFKYEAPKSSTQTVTSKPATLENNKIEVNQKEMAPKVDNENKKQETIKAERENTREELNNTPDNLLQDKIDLNTNKYSLHGSPKDGGWGIVSANDKSLSNLLNREASSQLETKFLKDAITNGEYKELKYENSKS